MLCEADAGWLPSDADRLRSDAYRVQSAQATAKGIVPINSTVAVIDDDASVREALRGLLKSAGFRAEVFASAEEFLDSRRLANTACLILDVRMSGMSGLELQEHLIASNRAVPIIFITAHGDEEARARALERGAVEFLQKPFSDETLLDAITRSIGTPTSG